MTVTALKKMTADEFLAMRDARDYELIDGRPVGRKLMGAHASYIAGQVSRHLGNFNERRPSGWVLESETTYRCFDAPDTLRRADVSFIRYGRLPGERLPDGYVDIAPDLAVEVVSPSNTADEVEDKVLEYLAAGVETVWVIYPHARTIHIRRRGGSSEVRDQTQQLEGESVLPGFSCPIEQLFPPIPATA
jgi:Uma2 family endonuclease